jgi:macrolide transport system ATP-binding/permease protein
MRDCRGRLERELAALALPPERLNDLVEELAQDLEERRRSAHLAGASEEEAAASAWAGLGSLDELRERLSRLSGWSDGERDVREAPPGASRGPISLGGLGQDLRLAFRLLRRSPAFTATALLILALGIGANTTLFGVVDALFLTPLPVREPERVVMVYTSDFSGPRYGTSSYPDFEDLRSEPHLFESLAAYTLEAAALSTGEEPVRVWCEMVSGGFFASLSVPMELGRPLGPGDDDKGADPAAVISHGLWRRRLAGDPGVLGRHAELSGTVFTIVGVAPPAFTGLTRGLAAEAWIPLALRQRLVPGPDVLENRGSRLLSLVGRLQPGIGIRDAQARVDVLASRLQAAHRDQWTDVAGKARRISLVRESQARVAPMASGPVLGFSALLGLVVALLLLVAGANVAGLMLARVSTRRRELAVRMALGASRARVAQHFFAESVLVAAAGGGLGVLIAVWASRILRSLSLPLPVPVHLQVVVDARVLVFGVGLTLVTGVLLGLLPAWHAAGPDLLPALKDEGGQVASGSRGRRLRRAFVVAQIALSMVLLVGAGLLLRGLDRATRLSPGFDVEDVGLVPVDVGLARYDVAQATALVDGLASRSAHLPGVRACGLSMTLPLDLHVARRSTLVQGHVPRPGEDEERYFGVVGPGHFAALGIRILRGREFTPADRADAPAVAIVNETFARQFWPGEDPIGRTIRLRDENGPLVTVVGLARDSKYRSLGEAPMPFYYLPILQDYGFVRRYARLFPLHVVVRGEGDPRSLARVVATALAGIDPKLPAYPAQTMTEHLGLSVLPSRVASSLFAAFGLLGLLLASLGLYGIVAYSVSLRTQEIGVRIALGATRRDVLLLVLREALGLSARGVALGAVLAVGVGPAMGSLLYGLSPFDPLTFAVVPLVLGVVALAATTIPARRAARVDPAVALRYQ